MRIVFRCDQGMVDLSGRTDAPLFARCLVYRIAAARLKPFSAVAGASALIGLWL
jgi:hypothetical protein